MLTSILLAAAASLHIITTTAYPTSAPTLYSPPPTLPSLSTPRSTPLLTKRDNNLDCSYPQGAGSAAISDAQWCANYLSSLAGTQCGVDSSTPMCEYDSTVIGGNTRDGSTQGQDCGVVAAAVSDIIGSCQVGPGQTYGWESSGGDDNFSVWIVGYDY